MNSFPSLNIDILQGAFDAIRDLYHNDKGKILEASRRATSGDQNPIVVTTGDIDPQIDLVRARVSRTADNYGLHLLIKIIEELFDDLNSNGAIGVNAQIFLAATELKVHDNSIIKYNQDKTWNWTWNLKVDDNPRDISLGVRTKDRPRINIVPSYILEYVQQSFIAYKQNRTAASLSLMTIALEGTLRDALQERGFTYTPGTPKEDVYELRDMQVNRSPNGYLITFPNAMPLDHNHFLANPGDPQSLQVRIKRIKRGTDFTMEIRAANSLLDYWSSSNIVTHGVRQVSGLGAALDIGRNHANIIRPIDLPPDLDGVIKAVRNNLIHLSGAAMTTLVDNTLTLGDFLKNKNKVFDAVCTIGETVNVVYRKITFGTL
jgi:hypothetical protein